MYSQHNTACTPGGQAVDFTNHSQYVKTWKCKFSKLLRSIGAQKEHRQDQNKFCLPGGPRHFGVQREFLNIFYITYTLVVVPAIFM